MCSEARALSYPCMSQSWTCPAYPKPAHRLAECSCCLAFNQPSLSPLCLPTKNQRSSRFLAIFIVGLRFALTKQIFICAANGLDTRYANSRKRVVKMVS